MTSIFCAADVTIPMASTSTPTTANTSPPSLPLQGTYLHMYVRVFFCTHAFCTTDIIIHYNSYPCMFHVLSFLHSSVETYCYPVHYLVALHEMYVYVYPVCRLAAASLFLLQRALSFEGKDRVSEWSSCIRKTLFR